MSKDKGKIVRVETTQHDFFTEVVDGFQLGQKHKDCPEFKAILEEMDKLTLKMAEHAKGCKK